MPLSLEKLKNLLTGKGLTPLKYFTLKGMCAYIEVVSSTSETFILSIPSKYKFDLEKVLSSNNIFKLKFLDVNDDNSDIAKKYAESPDGLDLEKVYTEIDVSDKLDGQIEDKKMEKRLADSYKRPIIIRDINKEDAGDVRDIFRQLKRLKYCVQSIRYKLVIIYRNYLCVLNTDDTIECFYIKGFPTEDKRRLYVSIDLELLIEKITSNITEDIQQIMSGIRKILDKNQTTHLNKLMYLISQKEAMLGACNLVSTKKQEYNQYIGSFEELLKSATDGEVELKGKLKILNDGIKGFNDDVGRVHQKQKLVEELNDILKTKEEILSRIRSIKTSENNMALTIDKVLFDNIVMTNSITNNLGKLDKLCKQL